MASIINASSTGSGGLISTGDASGVLQLQSNGSTQVTVASSGVTFNGNTAPLIIGGNNNGAYPTFQAGGALSWNHTAGSAEVDFWNTSSSPSNSFLWIQQTGTSTANALMNLSPTGNLTFNQSGSGVIFSNSSALTNSTLNDYETGTWTPTDASGGGISISVSSATYTKIGRLVTVTCYVTYPSTSNGNTAIIGGLPFAENGSSIYCVGSLSTNSSVIGNVRINTGSTSSVSLYIVSNNTAITNSQLSTAYVIFSLTYVASF